MFQRTQESSPCSVRFIDPGWPFWNKTILSFEHVPFGMKETRCPFNVLFIHMGSPSSANDSYPKKVPSSAFMHRINNSFLMGVMGRKILPLEQDSDFLPVQG